MTYIIENELLGYIRGYTYERFGTSLLQCFELVGDSENKMQYIQSLPYCSLQSLREPLDIARRVSDLGPVREDLLQKAGIPLDKHGVYRVRVQKISKPFSLNQAVSAEKLQTILDSFNLQNHTAVYKALSESISAIDSMRQEFTAATKENPEDSTQRRFQDGYVAAARYVAQADSKDEPPLTEYYTRESEELFMQRQRDIRAKITHSPHTVSAADIAYLNLKVAQPQAQNSILQARHFGDPVSALSALTIFANARKVQLNVMYVRYTLDQNPLSDIEIETLRLEEGLEKFAPAQAEHIRHLIIEPLKL